MAKKQRASARPQGAGGPVDLPEAVKLNMSPFGAVDAGVGFSGTTNRYLITMRRGATANVLKRLDNKAGKQSTARSSEFADAAVVELNAGESGRVVYDEFEIAIADFDPNQHRSVMAEVAGGDSPILAVEPERYKYALGLGPIVPAVRSLDYLVGYRDAINAMLGDVAVAPASAAARGILPFGPSVQTMAITQPASGVAAAGAYQYYDDNFGTYGLHLTNVIAADGTATRYTGSGVKIAILDTGLDFGHPDFRGRAVDQVSFIGTQTTQDGHGHGTHTAGTACGPDQTAPFGNYHARRYGVAVGAELYVGKVLMNNGFEMYYSPDANVINGIRWAFRLGCQIISMSLGEPVALGVNYQVAYEQIASTALESGCLILAAAGNDSNRPYVAPVSSPANCPSVIAVGAVDSNLQMYRRSNAFVSSNGWSSGQVDVAGPGVGVFSSYRTDLLPQWPYWSMDGTSMATPHAAGVAALWAEVTGDRGRALAARLQTTCAPVGWLSSRDIGRGIVQAPR